MSINTSELRYLARMRVSVGHLRRITVTFGLFQLKENLSMPRILKLTQRKLVYPDVISTLSED